jgi:hypothetical protein
VEITEMMASDDRMSAKCIVLMCPVASVGVGELHAINLP